VGEAIMLTTIALASSQVLLAIWAALSAELLLLFADAGIFRENRLWKL
jgi:hypothetical protein